MEAINNPVLFTLLRQRHALTALRKEILLSRTDIEVMAYATIRNRMFTLYELKRYFTGTNTQQLRAVVSKLKMAGVLQLVSQGVKNKPSVYWLSNKGEYLMEMYLKMI